MEMVCTGWIPSAMSSVIGSCDSGREALGLDVKERRIWVLAVPVTSYMYP